MLGVQQILAEATRQLLLRLAIRLLRDKIQDFKSMLHPKILARRQGGLHLMPTELLRLHPCLMILGIPGTRECGRHLYKPLHVSWRKAFQEIRRLTSSWQREQTLQLLPCR